MCSHLSARATGMLARSKRSVIWKRKECISHSPHESSRPTKKEEKAPRRERGCRRHPYLCASAYMIYLMETSLPSEDRDAFVLSNQSTIYISLSFERHYRLISLIIQTVVSCAETRMWSLNPDSLCWRNSGSSSALPCLSGRPAMAVVL